MKILILASYTGGQKYKPNNRLRLEDLSDSAHLDRRIKELYDYRTPAGEMFVKNSHKQIRAGLRQARAHEAYGQTTMDLYFPSNYYRVDRREDLVHEDDLIVPFDVEPLSGTGNIVDYGETAWSDSIQVLMEKYDLAFSLMERYHVWPLENLFQSQCGVTLILLAAPSWKISDPEPLSNTHLILYDKSLVKLLEGASPRNLRGTLFRKLCEVACRDGFHVFEQIKQNPQRLLEIIQDV